MKLSRSAFFDGKSIPFKKATVLKQTPPGI
jgi:hypothetical protein